MAKNDMPGMSGNATKANPYEGMWGPIGAGNAAPYGGNPMPWLQAASPRGGGGSIFSQIMQNQGGQNPNAAFNRPQFPGQGQPSFMGLGAPSQLGAAMGRAPQMSNPNGQALPQMAAASSMSPSQPQALIEKFSNLPQMGNQLMPGEMGGMPQLGQGGNIPPNSNALMDAIRNMQMSPQVEPNRMEMPGSRIQEMQQPIQEIQQRPSMAPSGSIFKRMMNRNG